MSQPTLSDARALLQRVFGHADFRGLQADVISEVLAGRDAVAVLPTGGGKSFCYQIPAILRPGVGLVISPLIALMQDQVAALRAAGVARVESRTAFLRCRFTPSTQPSVCSQRRKMLHDGSSA